MPYTPGPWRAWSGSGAGHPLYIIAEPRPGLGVYPIEWGDGSNATTRVRDKVNGTFGGRFENFGAGRFAFIAYTD